MTPRDAAFRALAYYDLFDFPLTAHEVSLTAPGGLGLEAACAALGTLRAEGAAACRDGLWHLSGRGAIAVMRKDRYALAEGKYARVRKFFRVARYAPFIRAIFVCNTLARSNAKSSSDIDLFVVAAPGRVWIARLFVTGLAALLRLRPEPGRTADRLCLSFFASEDALDLSSLAIPGDAYLPRWLHELHPVYDEAGVVGTLQRRNAALLAGAGRLTAHAPSHRRALASAGVPKKNFERLIERFGGARFEALAKRMQLHVMPERLKHAPPGSGVVVSDVLLKFHDADRRAEIRDRYERALRRVDAPTTHAAHPVPQLA